MPDRLAAFVRTLAFFVIAPGSVTVLVPWLLVRGLTPSGAPLIGAPLIGAGAALLLWSGFGFAFVGRGTPAPYDEPRELVVWGPYRWVRNPMYVGVLAVLVGEAMAFSAALLAYAALVGLVFHAFVVGYEEPHLAARFGASYETYRRTVPRWLPRPPREATA